MTWVWIVIAVVVVLAVVGLLVMAANKKKQEHRRTQAEELRTGAQAQSASVLAADRQARDAQADAARARAEAERAERQAAEASRARDMEHAAHEDQIREADRIDPDVDHRSPDYVPEAEPQRFDTQTGEPIDPDAQRGTTGFEEHDRNAQQADPAAPPIEPTPQSGQPGQSGVTGSHAAPTQGQPVEPQGGQHRSTSDPLTDPTHETTGQQPPEGTQTR